MLLLRLSPAGYAGVVTLKRLRNAPPGSRPLSSTACKRYIALEVFIATFGESIQLLNRTQRGRDQRTIFSIPVPGQGVRLQR